VKDVVVVGGGLGGLISGALLAKKGKSVTLIEQHSIVGGYATTFKRGEFTVEVGLHEMDGLYEKDLKWKIFDELGVTENIEFIRVPQFFKFKKGDLSVEIPDSFREAENILVEKFPNEKKGIEKFFKKIYKIGDEVDRLPEPTNYLKMALYLPIFPLLFPSIVFDAKKTVGELLDSIISDETLKQVLTGNVAYYHHDPYALSLLFFGIAQASYFKGGGHYIKGGSQKLSDYLRDVILQNGGEVILKHRVNKILVENGEAVGVQYKKKRGEEVFEIRTETVIFNGAIPNLPDMLPQKEREKIEKSIRDLEISPSISTLYLGFDRPLKELGNGSYSTMFYSIDSKFGDVSGDNWNLCDYSQIDAGINPEGKSFAVMIEVDFMKNWENLSKEEYKKRKEERVEYLVGKLEKEIPDVREHIIYSEFATPKTNMRYTLNRDGAIYGYAQTPKQSMLNRLQNRSPIKNLLYASAWTMPGGGFTGAMLSGYFASKLVK
jgi:all-trans-retinol 13,14-reductase